MNYSKLAETIFICIVWTLLASTLQPTPSTQESSHLMKRAAFFLARIAAITSCFMWLSIYVDSVTAWSISVLLSCAMQSFRNRRYQTETMVCVVLSFMTSLTLQLAAIAATSVVFLIVRKEQTILTAQLLKNSFHLIAGITIVLIPFRLKSYLIKFATTYSLGTLLISGILFTLAYEIFQVPYEVENKSFNQFALVVTGFCYLIAIYVCLNERKRKREIERLHNEVKDLSAKIHATKESIPAYRRRLEDLKTIAVQLNQEELSIELSDITSEFTALAGTIQNKDQKEYLDKHPLASTGLKIIDAQLANERQDAAELGIGFDCSIGTPLDELMHRYHISAPELQQIVGDLVRNAIKQTAHSGLKEKQIQVFFGETLEGYRIQVYDTAAYFALEILDRVGERGVTTNGTGNGLPDIIEVITPYRASLVIEEYAPEDDDFTKSVSILFDGAAEVRIVGQAIRRTFSIS